MSYFLVLGVWNSVLKTLYWLMIISLLSQELRISDEIIGHLDPKSINQHVVTSKNMHIIVKNRLTIFPCNVTTADAYRNRPFCLLLFVLFRCQFRVWHPKRSPKTRNVFINHIKRRRKNRFPNPKKHTYFYPKIIFLGSFFRSIIDK